MSLLDRLLNPFIESRVARLLETVVLDEKGWSLLSDQASAKDLSLATHAEQQKQAWLAYTTSPLAKRQVKYTTSFLIGRGFKVTSVDPDVQAVIDEFTGDEENEWEVALRELANRWQIEGEVFLFLFINRLSGRTIMRDIESSEIQDVIIDSDDARKVIGYKRVYVVRTWDRTAQMYRTEPRIQFIYPGASVEGDENTILDVVFWKRPTVSTRKRGLSDLASHLYWLTQFKQLLDYRVILNKARAAFVWHQKVGGGPVEVENAKKAAEKPPKPGTVKTTSDKIEWEAVAPNVGGGDAEPDLRAVKLMIVAGSGLPEHVATGDASNANYASTAEAGFAHEKQVEDDQDLFAFYLKKLLRRVVRAKQEAGLLGAEFFYRDDDGNATDKPIPDRDLIQITFPEIRPQDPLKEASALQIDESQGWVSKETAASRRGYDWKLEKEKIDKERAERPAAGDQFGQGGEQGFMARITKELRLGQDDQAGGNAAGQGPAKP